MNTQQQQQNAGHIIMFPYMAQGHITRFLALPRFISQGKPNIKITFVSAPLNIRRLQSALTSDNNIYLAELPFSSADHGLPPDSDNTDSLPRHLIITLLYASQTLKPSFDNLITEIITSEKRVPNCIIADTIFGWVHDTAKRVGTFHFAFTCGANDDSNDLIEEFHVHNFPDTCRLHVFQLSVHLRAATKEAPMLKFFRKLNSGKPDGVLCNSVEEIEAVGLETLRNLVGSKPIWTVGPLLPSSLLQGNKNNVSVVSHSRTGKEFGISPESCIEWLNLHKPCSFQSLLPEYNGIFVKSIIMSLEKSCKSFVWILRPPSEFDIKSEFKSEWLPEGFFERTSENNEGLLVKNGLLNWRYYVINQQEHFLSLSQGVPIIGWPMGAEQAFNSKMMEEEMGVSVQLANGNEGQMLSEDVQKVIEPVMDSSKGEEMRKRAMVIAEKISAAMREDEGGHEKGSSVRSIDDFLATVTTDKAVV
ncbi:hypothetical protein MKX01_000069 [Papaver californicum]|nr:hypothetical protein MKX01_000069 [Papaver californicum]